MLRKGGQKERRGTSLGKDLTNDNIEEKMGIPAKPVADRNKNADKNIQHTLGIRNRWHVCHKKLRVSSISEVEKPEFPSILESIIQAFQLRMIDFKILLQELKKQISIRNKI